MTRNFCNPGRSAVYAKHEMVATSHPLATHTAMDILSNGGNAVDAAIAACAVLCVVEPHMTGIGGDCFILFAEPNGKILGLNGSGRAPAKLDLEQLPFVQSKQVPPESIHSVTAPGAVRAWETFHKQHGRLNFNQILQPAIRYADEGFAVAPRVAHDWSNLTEKLLRDEAASRQYLPNGKPPHEGEYIRFPQLAETLGEIAESGADAFYSGKIAKDIADTIRNYGGFLNEDDLAKVETDFIEPVKNDYRSATVVELPPNGQGIIALLILAIMERFEISNLDPLGPERAHLMLESCRLAYSIRDQVISDADFSDFNAKKLLEPDYVDRLVDRINLASRMEKVEFEALLPGSDTVYLTVVDGDRRIVSMINSLFQGFGVGICTENTGIMLQNRGACFSLEKGHPNCIAAGKRPLHTIIPAMVLKNQSPWLSFGVMGGAYQPCGHAHLISNLLDFGMNLQTAIDLPRWFLNDTFESAVIEEGVPKNTVRGLTELGHTIEICQDPIGGGQAILMDSDSGGLIGASDPRKDGCALGR